MPVPLEMDQTDFAIEEYKSLREEILRRQTARQAALAFTAAVIGVLVSVMLGRRGLAAEEVAETTRSIVAGLAVMSLIVILGSTVAIMQNTQQIDALSAYIRLFIEPRVRGLGWETLWSDSRWSMRSSPMKGTSRPLALVMIGLTVGVCIAYWATARTTCWGWAVVGGLALLCLGTNINAYSRLRVRHWPCALWSWLRRSNRVFERSPVWEPPIVELLRIVNTAERVLSTPAADRYEARWPRDAEADEQLALTVTPERTLVLCQGTVRLRRAVATAVLGPDGYEEELTREGCLTFRPLR